MDIFIDNDEAELVLKKLKPAIGLNMSLVNIVEGQTDERIQESHPHSTPEQVREHAASWREEATAMQVVVDAIEKARG